MALEARSRPAFAVLLALTLTMLVPLVPLGPAQAATVHEVAPGDSIAAALAAAKNGDTLLLKAGVHHDPITIPVGLEGLTITGEGEGVTILDGDGSRADGIFVRGNRTTVRDLTVTDFRGNGVYFRDVTGFWVDQVTALDNGGYGIYAIRSRIGSFTNSFASGHSDSGFYLGEVLSCQCVIDNVTSVGNLIGYSGTGAGDITIRHSLFADNAAGIVPNVLPTEPTPQMQLFIHDNIVVDNNNETASQMWHFASVAHVPSGLGIILAGGIADLVTHNTVTGHDRAGVLVIFLFTEPSLNEVVHNVLDNPGPDIIWDAGGVNNCFEDNVRLDGTPATYDAGPLWNAVGLPDCDTPNAGAPDPVIFSRFANLLVYNCEPVQQPGAPCHAGPH